MKKITAANLRAMVELSEAMSKTLSSHSDYIEASKAEMEARAECSRRGLEITRLTKALATCEKQKEGLRIAYFKNNERIRMVQAYNALYDAKEAADATIRNLQGEIVNLKTEKRVLNKKCVLLKMEAGVRAEGE